MTGASRRSARRRIDEGGDSLRYSSSIRRGKGKELESIGAFKSNLKILVGLMILGITIIYFVINRIVVSHGMFNESQKPRVIAPVPSPKLMDLSMFHSEHKESLYWGTYRPHVYFGVRARTPQSLVAGLMWLGVKDDMYVMRHFCENSDDLSSFGWREHNGRDFGRQELAENDVILETSFVKSKGDSFGYGGDWSVRIDVKNKGLNDDAKKSAHLFFYLADEGGNVLSLSQDTLDFQGSSLLVSGSREDVGDWQIHLRSQNQLETRYSGFKTPHIHNLSDLVQRNLALQARKFGRLQLSDTSEDSSNIYIFQVYHSLIYFKKNRENLQQNLRNVSTFLKSQLTALSEKLLISDFVNNGSLADALRGRNGQPSPSLTWSTRLKIAKGAARGIAYLHECSPRKLVHGDVKPSNILLDSSFTPYISDFGLTRLITITAPSSSSNEPSSSSAAGGFLGGALPYTSIKPSDRSNGYKAPEARLPGSRPTQKWDVYSFGVVLMELLTGKSPDSSPLSSTSLSTVVVEVPDLVKWVRKGFEEETPLSDVVDPMLLQEVHAKQQVLSVFHLALACTEGDPEVRPRMKNVSENMDKI